MSAVVVSRRLDTARVDIEIVAICPTPGTAADIVDAFTDRLSEPDCVPIEYDVVEDDGALTIAHALRSAKRNATALYERRDRIEGESRWLTSGTPVRLKVGCWVGDEYETEGLTVDGVITRALRPGIPGNVMVACQAPAKNGTMRDVIVERAPAEIELVN